jgi:hypothetical protein
MGGSKLEFSSGESRPETNLAKQLETDSIYMVFLTHGYGPCTHIHGYACIRIYGDVYKCPYMHVPCSMMSPSIITIPITIPFLHIHIFLQHHAIPFAFEFRFPPKDSYHYFVVTIYSCWSFFLLLPICEAYRLHLEKSTASTHLFGITEARGGKNLGCSGTVVLFFENESLQGSVEDPYQSKQKSTLYKKHPNKKSNYMEINFAYNVVDREYMRVQESATCEC